MPGYTSCRGHATPRAKLSIATLREGLGFDPHVGQRIGIFLLRTYRDALQFHKVSNDALEFP